MQMLQNRALEVTEWVFSWVDDRPPQGCVLLKDLSLPAPRSHGRLEWLKWVSYIASVSQFDFFEDAFDWH